MDSACLNCHHDHIDAPLGLDPVLLAAPEATGETWAQLQLDGLLTSSSTNHTLPASSFQIPGNATERTALGYLHTTCALACHRPDGIAPFSMKLEVGGGAAPASVSQTAAFQIINAPASHVLASPPYAAGSANYYRIRPGDPSRSMVHLRQAVRDAPPFADGNDQMPPTLTHLVDAAGLAAIDAWINSMTSAPYPAPAAP